MKQHPAGMLFLRKQTGKEGVFSLSCHPLFSWFCLIEAVEDADQDDEDDRSKRHPEWHFVDITENHLRSDEDEHEAESVLQVIEAVNQVREDEVETTETKDCHDVRIEDDERVTRIGKACCDRVDGEDDIRDFDKDQRDQQRCEEQLAVDSLRELTGRDVLCDRQTLFKPTDRLVLFKRRFLPDVLEHHVTGVDEERTKDIVDPSKVIKKRNSCDDEDDAEEDGTENTPEQDFVLILQRNRKVSKDE